MTPRLLIRRSPYAVGQGSVRFPSLAWGESLRYVIYFLATQIVLAQIAARSSRFATLHGITALIVGLWFALSPKHPERVAYAAAYICGSEIMWRMSESSLFWEYGKYSTGLILIVSMLRRRTLNPPLLPILYFVLLLPSALITAFELPWTNSALRGWDARSQLSFYLSGPLALVVSVCFFSNLKLTREHLNTLLLAAIGPLVGIATVTLVGIVSAPEISFTGESNFETSGGFGPNQVSSVLGLGVLLAFLYVTDEKLKQYLRLLMLGVMFFLAIQCAITFSRGGLYNAAAGVILATFYLLKNSRSRYITILIIVAFCVLTSYVVLPGLDSFTGGALSARFSDTSLTGREEIIEADLEVWKENPVTGVGVGLAKSYREEFFRAVSAHTEFTRLLSEHGLLGLMAICSLLLWGAQAVRQAPSIRGKAVAAAMIGWTIIYMTNAAMRTVAPSFIIGLAAAKVWTEQGLARVVLHKSGSRNAPALAPIRLKR